MSRKTRTPLDERVACVAEAELADKGFVCALDVLCGLGWLDPGAVERSRRGQLDCVEEGIQANPEKQAEALRLIRSWATQKGLTASEADYVSRTPQRQALRFTVSGDAAVEAAYRTNWMSPKLSGKARDRLAEKASRPPELVVVMPRNRDWKCHRCGGSGDLLIMENPGPSCLACAGLGDLEFLPSGDALVTRRAKAASNRHAVVVYFSRTRKRYERQGVMVEPEALTQALQSLGRDRSPER